MVVRVHDEPPQAAAREALRLIDEQPALEPHLIALGEWIAGYYCAPLGEVLRVMAPVAGEVRQTKVYSLTDAGIDVARQLLIGTSEEDPATRLLRLLERRPLSASYLAQKVEKPRACSSRLRRRAWFPSKTCKRSATRCAPRPSACGWTISVGRRETKLKKAERELLSYLDLHPGSHNLAELESSVAKASETARSLARRKLVSLTVEPPVPLQRPSTMPLQLNEHQEAAFEPVREALDARRFVRRISAARRHGLGQDRSVSERHRVGARRWAAARCCWFRRSR